MLILVQWSKAPVHRAYQTLIAPCILCPFMCMLHAALLKIMLIDAGLRHACQQTNYLIVTFARREIFRVAKVSTVEASMCL